MSKKRKSAADVLSQVDAFLGEFRAEKEAASEMDTVSIKDLETNDGVTSEKKELGKEQSQAAEDAGATVETVPANKDGDDKQKADEQGVKTLDADQTVEGNSDVIGVVQKQEVGMNQKIARAERLGNDILSMMVEGVPSSVKEAAEDQLINQFIEKSAAVAQDAFESHLLGQIQRAVDEQELSQEGAVDPSLVKEAGGVGALLDKMAAEFPEAVLPEGAVEEALPEGVPEVLPEGVPKAPEGTAPMEASLEGDEDGVGETEVEELVNTLDEAGVTPEELAEAVQEVQALVEAGVDPEELAQGIGELMDEEGAGEEGAGAEGAPEEIAPEAVAPEVLPEELKEASEDQRRQRIDSIKSILRNR